MDKRTPRIYQRTAIFKATRALREYGQALVVMATGLGKTLTSAWTMKRIGKTPGLFLVHNNQILRKSRDKEYASVFPNLTFGTFNGKNKNIEGADIVFATLQTMHNHLSLFKPDYFKWLVFDESHHAHAQTFKKVIDHFKCLKLAMTATPNRMDRKDIRELFGNEVVDIQLEEAIVSGWLPRVEYRLMTDDSLNEHYLRQIAKQVLQNGERIPLEQIKKRLFVKKREKKVAEIIQKRPEKAVIFCQSIQHADEFSKLLKNANVYHSQRCEEDNDIAFKELENGLVPRLCAVNAFNEGVDIPDIGLVVFARTTESETIWRQQMGRGLRPGKHKLIILDFVGNLERIRMIKRIVDKIAEIKRKRKDGGVRGPQNFRVVSGRKFKFTFSKQIVDILKIADRVGVEPYQTWQEAAEVVRRIGCQHWSNYRKLLKKDPRLPSHLERTYLDFPGWEKFIGRGKYETWQEASLVVRRLEIKGQAEHRKRWKEDPRLPACPNAFYRNYPGDSIFFRGKIRYETWQEASEASIKLGLKSGKDYVRRYKEDRQLPSDASRVYKNFPGWPAFLETDKKTHRRRRG